MSFKEYHKIESLWKFDQETKEHIKGWFINEDVELLQNCSWLFTEKVDGTNFRIYWDGHTLQYGGRTANAQFSDFQKSFIKEHLVNENQETVFEQLFQEKEVIVYGELYGHGINKGGLYVDDDKQQPIRFKVFDILIEDVYLKQLNMVGLCESLGYDYVPLVLIGTINDGLQYLRDNEKSSFSNAPLEGLVAKPMGDFRNRLGKRIIVKLKPRDV